MSLRLFRVFFSSLYYHQVRTISGLFAISYSLCISTIRCLAHNILVSLLEEPFFNFSMSLPDRTMLGFGISLRSLYIPISMKTTVALIFLTSHLVCGSPHFKRGDGCIFVDVRTMIALCSIYGAERMVEPGQL